MTPLFWFGMFVALVLLSVVLMGANKWADKKLAKPLFYYNHVGSKWALCSAVDFNEAVRSRSMLGTKVMAKETLRLPNSDYLWGEYSSSLFVPFASEGLVSFADQHKFFIDPEEVGGFEKRKKLEALAADRSLRFATWYKKSEVGNSVEWIILAAVIMFFVWGFSAISSLDKKNAAQEVVIYTTSTDGVHEIKTTNGKVSELLVRNGVDDNYIYHGKVAKVQVVAVGLTRVCLTRDQRNLLCGFATAEPQVGDDVFLRYAKVATYYDRGNDRAGYLENTSWTISKPEADALIATGKFKIVD